MQVFIPYASPYECAKCLDSRRFAKQILETRQILAAIYDNTRGYANHPVTKMYIDHAKWLSLYLKTLERYRDKNFLYAKILSCKADLCRPEFITQELCDQHKRRLYTKAPAYYKSFAHLGKSLQNWYFVDGEMRKYINGKRIW
jgi:hypothetical protein